MAAPLHTLHQIIALRFFDLGIANCGANGGTDDGTSQCLVATLNSPANGPTCTTDRGSFTDMPLSNTAGFCAALGLIS